MNQAVQESEVTIEKLLAKIDQLEKRIEAQESREEQLTLVAFSGDFDKLMAAFVLAVGAQASGKKTTIFFTFWGLAAIRKKARLKSKSILEKMTSICLPAGPDKVGTSRMNLLGVGPAFFKNVMKRRNVQSLPELIDLATELGVKLVACQTSMEIMGIGEDELREDVTLGGATACVADAMNSKATLFI